MRNKNSTFTFSTTHQNKNQKAKVDTKWEAKADKNNDGVVDEQDKIDFLTGLDHYADVDNNGVVDIYDIQFIIGLVGLDLSPKEASNADINGDGLTDIISLDMNNGEVYVHRNLGDLKFE